VYEPQSVLQLCEHVVWLDEARVVANGPASQVVDAFVSRFTTRALSTAG
jgi:ABC-type glutathione transport system ATPase component